jgi:hypothetical protein
MRNVGAMLGALIAICATGCEEETTEADKTAASAKSAVAPPEPAAAAPVASAPPPEPRSDCPQGSSGPGTFDKPCEGSGTTRLMEAKWNGKMTDKGPPFNVKNIAKLPILYGKMAVYFYDKAGKQLEVKGGDDSAKPQPVRWCAGKIFEGPMKVDEKALITFSCVKKETVPEGTAAIEAELQMVGFTDDEAQKTEFYWRNKDLTPDARPKSKK